MTEIKDENAYWKLFPKDEETTKLRLEKILDIRKFEIELYWKRAAYFWTFIAAALTGYGLTITSKSPDPNYQTKFQFLLICLGIVFSFAWYLVNRASKFWQENWEKHLDLTEDSIIGPLYKTTINKKTYSSFWNLTSPYAASVSKINQILSLFILSIWFGLLLELFTSKKIVFVHFCSTDFSYYYSFVGLLTLTTLISLGFGAKTNVSNSITHFTIRKNAKK